MNSLTDLPDNTYITTYFYPVKAGKKLIFQEGILLL